VPKVSQVYEYISRYSSDKFVNIVNSLLKTCNKNYRKSYKKYIVDSTAVECDINHVKQYISLEKLKKLKLKWGYSTTKGYFIGFKVTVVLDEKTLCPVSILIHPGAPNDSKLFDQTLKELKRRRIIKPKNILLFDKGYYSYDNYNIGINRYQVICIIFPKSTFDTKKLDQKISYSLEVFKKKKPCKRK
jgi:transposase